MNETNLERSEAWNIYSSSEPSSPSHSEVNGTSMDAISFGFVATAILISMFLVMAIFEHLFKPSESYDSSTQENTRPSHSRQMQKMRDQNIVPTSCTSDFSVVMPGEKYATFIAQPAPLPCPRETVSWPCHEHNFTVP